MLRTQTVTYKQDQPPVFGYVRDGRAGNYEVILKMIELTRASVLMDKGLENFTKSLLKEHGLSAHSDAADIFALFYQFVNKHVTYVQDAAGRTEYIKDARTTLEDGFGDCDDHAILIATMLAMVGFEPSFAVARYDNATDRFQHVYTVVNYNGDRYVFDTTLNDGGLNTEVTALEIKEFPIFNYREELDGFSGTVRGVKQLLKDTASNGLQFFDTVSAFVPFGAIPRYTIAAGAAMLSGAGANTTRAESVNYTASLVSGELSDLIKQLQIGKIPIEIARARAMDIISRFASLKYKFPNNEAFAVAEKNILQKLYYINNFDKNPNTAGLTVHLDTNLMALLGIGLAVIGGYFLLADR